jgi:hypothetical protein
VKTLDASALSSTSINITTDKNTEFIYFSLSFAKIQIFSKHRTSLFIPDIVWWRNSPLAARATL